MNVERIRNFSIIAHIDHGKSTLADRLLEAAGTIEKRKMTDQVLDRMDLERERGITIKMQPVRMEYSQNGENYILNLIDTPGHIDFAYEVSRALKAVEGALLLVDATQGVQAQTLSTLGIAREQNLVIIPVITKIDAQAARTEEVSFEVAELLGIPLEDVCTVSGKTGEGVPTLLNAIVKRIPPPRPSEKEETRALVFDCTYSNHKGVIVHVRVFDGKLEKRNQLVFAASGTKFTSNEVGIFAPDETPREVLTAGEIGYVVTGIKEPGIARVGDTLQVPQTTLSALADYQTPQPVVWASIYPESQDDFAALKQALDRLRLSDSSLSYEEESSQILGRGFRCGLLGMLHMEIVVERLRREFSIDLTVTTPSIAYTVTRKNGAVEIVYSPSRFPEYGDYEAVEEPWVDLKLMFPAEYMNAIMPVIYEHEGDIVATETFSGERVLLKVEMPLRELMRGFFDTLKSTSSGYASLSYEISGTRKADVARLDILVAEEEISAFTRIVGFRRIDEDGIRLVEKLHETLPKQLFVTKIQAKARGRIISSKALSAMRKDVTGHLYGGDITRKKKLLEKQKKGKKKMKERGKVNIPHEVFMKMMKE
jgi:GTP-binding protein LepA